MTGATCHFTSVRDFVNFVLRPRADQLPDVHHATIVLADSTGVWQDQNERYRQIRLPVNTLIPLWVAATNANEMAGALQSLNTIEFIISTEQDIPTDVITRSGDVFFSKSPLEGRASCSLLDLVNSVYKRIHADRRRLFLPALLPLTQATVTLRVKGRTFSLNDLQAGSQLWDDVTALEYMMLHDSYPDEDIAEMMRNDALYDANLESELASEAHKPDTIDKHG